jgi:quercetin dioxygenase-like cupin family protein
MKAKSLLWTATFAALAAFATPCAVSAAGTDAPRETITPAFQQPILNVPGKTMTAIVVDYAPGGKSPSHRHGSAFVVGYVLQGAIRSKVNSGEEKVYHAGESWVEAPGAHHMVSENASDTEPAKLLAIFVADHDDKDLVTWDKHPK